MSGRYHGAVRAFLALALVGCSSAAAPPPKEPVKPAGSGAPAAPATDVSDPDGDRILGSCDVCPTEQERGNDWANDDGCPETDAEILAATTDPTNQYSGPLFTVEFSGSQASAPVERVWTLDDEIEAVACVANAPDLALAKKRAARICKTLKASAGKIKIVEQGSSNPQLYVDQYGRARETVHGTGVIQVLRAAGVDIWRWDGNQLARVTKSRIVEGRPLPEGCTWVSFEEDRATGRWSVCPNNDCKLTSRTEGFRARWVGPPTYPQK